MKKTRSKVILFIICGLIMLMICGLALHVMMDLYKRKAEAKEFVDYLIEHADEASADFETCGLVFSVVEKGDRRFVLDPDVLSVADADMLIVTDADGWHFGFQPSAKYGDRLVQIEGYVTNINENGKEKGVLRIYERHPLSNYVNVIRSNGGHMSVIYRIPEFDEYMKGYRAEEAVAAIRGWISNEELAALYKKGKELEEILSAYCELKRHHADVSISSYGDE